MIQVICINFKRLTLNLIVTIPGDEQEQLKHEAWYAAMQEVLDHLAQVLTLEAFLSVLPTGSKDTEDFQGHIQVKKWPIPFPSFSIVDHPRWNFPFP